MFKKHVYYYFLLSIFLLLFRQKAGMQNNRLSIMAVVAKYYKKLTLIPLKKYKALFFFLTIRSAIYILHRIHLHCNHFNLFLFLFHGCARVS